MDGYATHLEALAWAVARTEGPILELGGGWYSTPMLHGIAIGQARRVVTIEPAEDTRRRLVELYGWGHHLVLEPGEDGVHPGPPIDPRETWSVVLVDHGESLRRAESVRRYLPYAELVVVHDTQEEVAGYYPGLAELLQEAARRGHIFDFTALSPETCVLAGARYYETRGGSAHA